MRTELVLVRSVHVSFLFQTQNPQSCYLFCSFHPIESGTPPFCPRQVQIVTLAANEALSGDFTVTYPGIGSTQPLAHDASAEVFASALRALDDPDGIIGGAVTVSRSRTGARGYAWTVTFDDLAAGDRPQLVVAETISLETRTTDGIFSLVADTVADGVAAIGGSFEILFADETVGDGTEESTGPLAAQNVSVREVEAAVEALSGVGNVTVDIELLEGGERGRVFTVTWPQGRGNVPALRANGLGLTPTSSDVGDVSEAAAVFVDEVCSSSLMGGSSIPDKKIGVSITHA